MHRVILIGMAGMVLTIGSFAFSSAAEKKAALPKETQFLTKAAGGQLAEITLGQLAEQRAESRQVKQFGQRMVQDHQKASLELKQLAAQEQVVLPTDMPPMHQEKARRFAQLSGKDFDRAYIGYMRKDHVKDVAEFEGAKELTVPPIRQWASATLPVLKEHLKMAEHIADDLGLDGKRP